MKLGPATLPAASPRTGGGAFGGENVEASLRTGRRALEREIAIQIVIDVTVMGLPSDRVGWDGQEAYLLGGLTAQASITNKRS